MHAHDPDRVGTVNNVVIGAMAERCLTLCRAIHPFVGCAAPAANEIFRRGAAGPRSTTTLPMVLCAFGSPANDHVPDGADGDGLRRDNRGR